MRVELRKNKPDIKKKEEEEEDPEDPDNWNCLNGSKLINNKDGFLVNPML